MFGILSTSAGVTTIMIDEFRFVADAGIIMENEGTLTLTACFLGFLDEVLWTDAESVFIDVMATIAWGWT